MKHRRAFSLLLIVFGLLLIALPARAQTSESAIAPRVATVNGLKLHYLTAGNGPTIILIHGYTQTSRMWRPLIPGSLQREPRLRRGVLEESELSSKMLE